MHFVVGSHAGGSAVRSSRVVVHQDQWVDHRPAVPQAMGWKQVLRSGLW